jgi:RTX calcium-binding nonapeptide repeat (4 copies)
MRIRLALTIICGALVAGGLLSSGATGASQCTTVIRGTTAPDALIATAAGARVLGLEGNDRISGSAGADCIDGGPGDDRIAGLAGGDTLEGAAGRDTLTGGAGADELAGGAGADKLSGGPGADRISDVPDTYEIGFASANNVAAGPGGDRVDIANGRRDKAHCGPGRDVVVADREDRLEGCERKRFERSPLPQAAPRAGGRRQMFMVRFRALEEVASEAEHFSIVVTGPRAGCGRIETSSLGIRYRAGETVRYRLKPFGVGGKPAERWCRGVYRGTVDFTRGAEPPLRIGRFSFRVR